MLCCRTITAVTSTSASSTVVAVHILSSIFQSALRMGLGGWGGARLEVCLHVLILSYPCFRR